MYTNMTFPAPFAVLGFLAACAGTVLGGLAIASLQFAGKKKLAAQLAKLGAVAAFLYIVLLLGFSTASRERTLGPGQQKYFCEIDCHLAYSIAAFKQTPDSAGKTLYTVTVRTYFDPNTISPQRPKDAPLSPNPRDIRLVDSAGSSYAPVSSSGTPFTDPLKPGDSYTTDLVFEPARPLLQPRLLLTSSGWPEHWLIGSEQSWGHRKTYLGL